jgi:deoxyribodipyrimidine photo-lyase
VIRRGDVAEEISRLAREVDASRVHLAADYSRYAVAREARLRDRLGRRELVAHDAHVVVAPHAVCTASGHAYQVFTPYLRAWLRQSVRRPLPRPDSVCLPDGLDPGRLPSRKEICPGSVPPGLQPGGETAARARATKWLAASLGEYEARHDDLGRDATSRLSAYLHFGCISPVDVVSRVDRRRRGAAEFVRQVAWRDFFHQVLAERPTASVEDWRTRDDRWLVDPTAYQAWCDGRTGFPLVDAGMRQLRAEGWMHNRARLAAASVLTKHLYIDWRAGARQFFDHLVDGDVANNSLNWQWVAGTGTDTRPNRVLNPIRQQQRYDPDLRYVRRYVEEFGTAAYPAPIVDHAAAVAAFRAARARRGDR